MSSAAREGRPATVRVSRAIQPHGVFLAADLDTLTVTHVSDTLEVLGVDPFSLLGRPLSDAVGKPDWIAAAARTSDPSAPVISNVVTIGQREFDALIHRRGDRLFAELEPRIAADTSALIALRRTMRSMATADSATELWDRVALGVREVTGYDRVNVSFLHPDGHGEVMGAAQADGIESHRGLHFPASNIPDEPLGHYLSKPSRLIVNSLERNVDVLADSSAAGGEGFEGSAAILAAPSARDLQLLEGLGHVSTFSLAIVRNRVLLGFITCAHRTERRIAYSLRDGLELVANQLSLQLTAMEEIHLLRQRDAVRETRAALVEQLAGGEDISSALVRRDLTLLDLIPADGAAIRLNGILDSIGTVPDPETLDHLPAIVAEAGGAADFSSDALPVEFPLLAFRMPHVAGLLLRQLSTRGDYIAWFRRESSFGLDWIRDLSAHNDSLEPSENPALLRAGHPDSARTSVPWAAVEAEASELSRAVESARLNLARSELADLALRDPLTGLANRRALIETVNRRLASEPSAGELAMLFVDIDHFKSINDRYGHAAGDQALIHIASILHATAREGDVIARLGGDEFVILLDRSSRRKADLLASRIIDAIKTAPPEGSGWSVTASVGVTIAEPGQNASELLSAADNAMFRAKAAGRDRVST